MQLLLLNAGSSGLKFSVMRPDGHVLMHGATDHGRGRTDYAWQAEEAADHRETVSWSGVDAAVRHVISDVRLVLERTEAPAIHGVAHRVVHGGTRFTEPVVVTPDVRARLGELVDLAPLHVPQSLAVLDAAVAALPDVPQVAVFDTAFHATLAPEAYTYPLPAGLTARHGLRRFGFHGLSHQYSAERIAGLLERRTAHFRVVVAHLGSGASVTAVRDGHSVDTSMGFTPLEGLMMGTRSGTVDPGLLLYLIEQKGIDPAALDRMLNHESGLLGVSGVSSDEREVAAASRDGNAAAALALRIFVHRARQAIGAMAVTLGGVDALVFTGGIGEHSPRIRAAICEGLECLGLRLDSGRNASLAPDALLTHPDSAGHVAVITAREDLIMARSAARVLGAP